MTIFRAPNYNRAALLVSRFGGAPNYSTTEAREESA
jgi:hypothetical protein